MVCTQCPLDICMCPTVAHRNTVISFLLANVTAGSCHGQAHQSNEQIRRNNCNSRHFNKLAHSGGVLCILILLSHLIAYEHEYRRYNHKYHKHYSKKHAAQVGRRRKKIEQHIIFKDARTAYNCNCEHENKRSQHCGEITIEPIVKAALHWTYSYT